MGGKITSIRGFEGLQMIKKTFNVIAVFTFAFFCTFVSFFPAPILHAQEEQADALPTAEEVFDRYAEELGGLMSIGGIESARLTMKQEVDGPGAATFGGDGKMDFVWLSEIGWTINTSMGVRSTRGNWKGKGWRSIEGADSKWLEGEEARQSKNMMPSFVPAHVIDWLDNSDKAKVIGKEELEETDVYVVEIEQEDGPQQKVYFEIETGLLFAMGLDQQMGLESVMFVKDYREFQGLMVPYEYEYKIGQMNITMFVKVEEIEFNGDVDESDLQLPDELLNDFQDSEDK